MKLSRSRTTVWWIFVGLLFTLLVWVPHAHGQTYQVLLVGDSWAQLMWFYGTLNTVFANHGRSDLNAKGDTTAISGSEASQWASAGYLQLITDELDANPSIEVVQLVIGGNDFLAGMSGGGWYQGMSEVAEDALFARIVEDIETVVDHILAYDPEIQVLVSSYDYANFVESLSGILAFQCLPTWNDLGQPTPEQINTAGSELEVLRSVMLSSKPGVTSVHHYGFMQWAYGYPSQGIPPGQLIPPGDITLPSPPEAMALGADCIHLASPAYELVVEHLWREFYVSFFGLLFEDDFETGDLSGWSP